MRKIGKRKERFFMENDSIRSVNKEELIEKALTKLKTERRGARVFCVRCGSTGQRTPLRRWYNSYICNECWKILKAVGEEEFLKEMKG